MRARIFAFAIACIMVAPSADAQGNRGNSNGVPGNIASIQAVVNAVLAQIATLPNFATLQTQLTALQTQIAGLQTQLNALSATVAGLSGLQGQINGLNDRVNGVDSRLATDVAALNARIDAATAQLEASLAAVEGQLQTQLTVMDARLDGLDGQVETVSTTLGTVSGDLSSLTGRVVTLEGASGGGATSPIIWSGGCTTTGAAGAQRYCTDGIDFDSAAGYVTVATNGVVAFDRAGMYRVTLSAVSQGVTGSASAKINGAVVSQTFSSVGTVVSNKDVTLSFVHPFSEGDVMEIYLTNSPVSYLPWAAAGGWSRLQIEYVGP